MRVSHRLSPPFRPGRSGFTLIELLLTLTLMSILMGLGLPALQNMIGREKLLGASREIAVVMRSARLEAIKTKGATVFLVDTDKSKRTVMSYVDEDDDGVLDLGERVLHRNTVGAGVYFAAPSGTAITDVIDGLEKSGTQGLVRFNSDGSVDATGAIRYADSRGNFLEVRIEPVSVARVKIRKWDGTGWYGKDDMDGPWVWY